MAHRERLSPVFLRRTAESPHFQSRTRGPLLPPQSAVMRRERACVYAGVSHSLPPATDRVHGKGRRVVIDPHADPAGVTGQVVHAVRDGLSSLNAPD